MPETISEEDLKHKQSLLGEKELIIIKFTATWCGPCKVIQPHCLKFLANKPNSIQYYEIDIDESLELYMKLKKMKMVNGIPALIVFIGGKKDHWFVPDIIHSGSNVHQLEQFFLKCLKYVC
jgi:thiol-disulfide isomerase/thioredoxin